MPTYFIQSIDKVGPIKIGQSEHPKRRLKQIEKATGKKLVILGLTNEKEHALHFKFKEIRVEGEWFEPTQELLDFIKSPYHVPNPPSGGEFRIIRSKLWYKIQAVSDIMQSLNDDGQDEILKFAQHIYNEAL